LNVVINKNSQELVEVYLNPKDTQNLEPTDASYAGTLGTFSIHSGEHGMGHGKASIIVANHLLKNGLNYINKKENLLYIIVRSNSASNSAAVELDISVKSVRLVLANLN
jgi:hypothetical protein